MFMSLIGWLRTCPALFVSFLVYVFCTVTVILIYKYFKYVGLCCYIILCGIIANIQVLYPTKYELMSLPVLLGTVVFSSTFLAVDLANENYGDQIAKKSVLLSVICNLFFMLNMILMLGHKPLMMFGLDEKVEALTKIFVPQVRVIFASYISFLSAQSTEIMLLKFVKNNVFLHNVSLFISSILVDNIVFTLFAFVLFGDGSFTAQNVVEVSISAIITRLCCNLLNSIVYKLVIKRCAQLGKDIL